MKEQNQVLLVAALTKEPRRAGTNFPMTNFSVANTVQTPAGRTKTLYVSGVIKDRPSEWLLERGHSAGDLVTVFATLRNRKGGKSELVATRIEPVSAAGDMLTDSKGGQRLGPGLAVNSVMVVGNLAADPEPVSDEHGERIRFGVVVDASYLDRKTGERVEAADYVQVTAWREVIRPLKKGERVMVRGMLEASFNPEAERRGEYHGVEALQIVPLRGKT